MYYYYTTSTMVKPRRKAVKSWRVSEYLRFYCEYLEISGQSRGICNHFRSIHPPCETTMSTAVPDGAAESANAQPSLVGYQRHLQGL